MTLTITDYNQNTTARFDVNLIITDLQGINRPPTIEEENDTARYALKITQMEPIYALLLAAIVYISVALINGFVQT